MPSTFNAQFLYHRSSMSDSSTTERFSNYDKHYYAPDSSMRIMPGLTRMIARSLQGNVLDIGTGDGLKLVQLLETADTSKIDKVVVCEPSPMHEAARKNLARFPFVTVTQTPFSDITERGYFDTIMMYEVIEHIYDTDTAVGEIKALLKPDGCFLGSTPNRPIFRLNALLTRHDDPTHVSEMTVGELQQLLGKHFSTTILKGFLPLAFIFRTFPKLDIINRFYPPHLSRTVYFFCANRAITTL